MTSYCYVAVNARGSESRGTLEVADQLEAIRRVKEMGLYPTKIFENRYGERPKPRRGETTKSLSGLDRVPLVGSIFRGRVRPPALAVFTRQLATLIEAGLPLLRGLRILAEQEENRVLKLIIEHLAVSIENGSSLTEGAAEYPKVFSKLYLNMVKAGELGGALDLSLKRLAEFMEKAQKIKGKIKAAMFYPCAVLIVAMGILVLLMGFIVPRFKSVFDGLFNGAPLPAFTGFVFRISEAVQHQIGTIAVCIVAAGLLLALAKRTVGGRWLLDQFKLSIPVLGPLYRKAAISRFSRTLGTLLGNGVPILQALTIVRETAGNMIYASIINRVHASVKEGDPIAPTLKASGLFPSMVAGMVDVGEQTGALPDMFMRVADTYDEQVDNAVGGLTSLLEPVMILFLAVIVGSIVIAMFLPIITAQGLINGPGQNTGTE